MMIHRKPIIAITVGDFNGVGPEVVLKSVTNRDIRRLCVPVVIGPRSVFEWYCRSFQMPLRLAAFDPEVLPRGRDIPLIETASVDARAIQPGRISARAGNAAARSIQAAVKAVQSGLAEAVVTAPISKQSLHLAGVREPGHTEMLQRLTRSRRVAMMLVAGRLRVGLVTIHEPLARVARLITPRLLEERIETIHRSLQTDWRIRNPRIAVLGLNPHAGEAGKIGKEEVAVIIPSMKKLRLRGISLEGPFSADSFFGMKRASSFDAVVAMYHDQGLIPLKMSSFGQAVNVSVGLPIVRTSPDHGTAFDIAGKKLADSGSMRSAIKLAVMISQNRKRAR